MPPRTYDSHVSVAIHKLLVPLHPFIRFIQLTYQELRHWLILLFASFYQQTSLHLAASGGHAVTVESLLNKGADINITDKDGVSYTWLHVHTTEKYHCFWVWVNLTLYIQCFYMHNQNVLNLYECINMDLRNRMCNRQCFMDKLFHDLVSIQLLPNSTSDCLYFWSEHCAARVNKPHPKWAKLKVSQTWQ